MATQPIQNAASAATSLTPTAAGMRTQVDKNQFLKLLVAQISHQDPLKPMESTEYAAQLAQFSQVEQAVAQTSALETLSAQMTALANNESIALVGKTATLRGGAMGFNGSPISTNFKLAGPANAVEVTVRDAEGNPVRTLNYGAQPGGNLQIEWDGRGANGQPAQPGRYTFDVKATTADGRVVLASQNVTGVISKVSFDKGYPEVTLDSGAVAPISDLSAIGMK